MTSPKVFNEQRCKNLSFTFEGLLPGIYLLVILEPSCKVIKEMLFRIVLSSVDHLPSRSSYIFYENPWLFVPSPQCIAIPYPLCIWIFPLWPPDSVSLGSYSVSVGSYTLFLSALTLFLSPHLLGFPTLQPISLYGNAPFVLHLEKYHPFFVLPLSPHPSRSPFPVSRCAPFFFSCPAIPIPLCPSIQLPPLFSPATPRH